MKVSEFMQRPDKSKGMRDRTTYRAARRNIAKIDYRRQKKVIAASKKGEK